METREITEYKVYVLCLANMHGGVDRARPVAVFDSLDLLKEYYQSQLAEQPYTDTPSEDDYGNERQWYKVFKKDSLLEWFNPADSLEVVAPYECSFGGVFSEWVDSLSFNIPFNPNN